MTKNVEKIFKAYFFLLDKEKNHVSFTINEMASSIGWKHSTISTYINKQWKNFISKTSKGYICSGLSKISQEDFLKINSQKIKYESLILNDLRELVHKARHFALLAVAVYNNPFAEFKVYGFIVNMVIAWTALFHAIFEKTHREYFYLEKNSNIPKKVDVDTMAWELSTCLEEYWKGIKNPVKSNLEILLRLRNKIEHRFLPILDLKVAGLCQACLTNFEEILVKKFGDENALNASLSIALQFSGTSEESQIAAMKTLQTKHYNLIKNFMDDFESNLASNILESQKYRVSLFLIPKLSNHKTSADLPIEFVRYDENDPKAKERLKKCVEVIREKTVEKHVEKLVHYLRPTQVVTKVSQSIQKKFTSFDHVIAWKYYKVRPVEANSTKCVVKYVKWFDLTKCYLYSDEWVNFLIKKLNQPDIYQKIVKLRLNHS